MFVGSRQAVLRVLDTLIQGTCSYHMPGPPGSWKQTRCDCKYGGANIKIEGTRVKRTMGEQTGCPELRSAYLMIEALDDHAWLQIIQATGNVPSGLLHVLLEDREDPDGPDVVLARRG